MSSSRANLALVAVVAVEVRGEGTRTLCGQVTLGANEAALDHGGEGGDRDVRFERQAEAAGSDGWGERRRVGG